MTAPGTNSTEARAPVSPPTPRGKVTAITAALAGLTAIWLLRPYNDMFLENTILIAYLPGGAVAVTLVLSLVLNPLLRRVCPRWAMRRGDMALAVGIMIMGAIVTHMGLHRQLIYPIARIPQTLTYDGPLDQAYRRARIRRCLFPDAIAFGASTPVSDGFFGELLPGESIPWVAWVKPALAWGAFLIFCWLMTIALAMIVLPQWRSRERLAFPLLTVYRPLVEEPEPGRAYPPLFRERLFWIGAGAVLLIHLLHGLNTYFPERVPAIPLAYDLRPVFSGEISRYIPSVIKANQVYFLFVGVAFIMPSRVGFSLWFFGLAYAFYCVLGNTCFPPFHWQTIRDHRVGAMFAIAAGIVWLGRDRWLGVARCLVRKARDQDERRDRCAGFMLLSGGAGMYGWLLWNHVNAVWALAMVGFAGMISLLIARLVCETGLPFLRLDCGYQFPLLRHAPVAWLDGATIYFASAVVMLFSTASVMNPTAMATQAFEIDSGWMKRRGLRLALLFVGVLTLGYVLCGAAHLYVNYHHGTTYQGKPFDGGWGAQRLVYGNRNLLALEQGRTDLPVHNQLGHIAFGAGLAGVLMWLSMTFTAWPLHPIGLLTVYSYFHGRFWYSVMLGWGLKKLILRYGGSRLYRSALPLFLGLILGEVAASIFWAFAAAYLASLGYTFPRVVVLP